MLKDYRSLIEEYRKKNGLSMQEICGDYISHSSYSRFIKKNQTLSADKLIYMIDRLDLNFREVGLFDQVIFLTNDDKVRMARVLDSGDLQAMADLADEFSSVSKREYDTHGMMAIRIRLKIGGEIASQQVKKLYDYLSKVEQWDYKEMYLFTFIIDKVESSIIQMVVKRVYNRAADSLYLERNLNLTILLDEAHFEFLRRGEFEQAQQVLQQLSDLVINKSFQTVFGLYSISQALHQNLVQTNPENFNKIGRLYRNLIKVQSDFLAIRLKNRYDELKTIHDLTEIEW